ncbi:MAG: protease modulator HflC [Rickettsiaceae bacterium]|nr:protease modulator HflC [Rickettsiaceae bacterium]
MPKINIYLITVPLVALIILLQSFFTVDERKMSIVFQFGEAVRVIKKPGLYMKIPLIQNVISFDNRILHIDAEAKELTASDGKRIIIDAFAKYKISDPVVFYKTVNNQPGASVRLSRIVESQMRKVIGKNDLISLLSSSRRNIIQEISDNVKIESEKFGINVLDVRILRADLPHENSAAIYKRMQTEREKEAKQIRAEGEEEAARIRSKADKEAKIILAEAYKKSEIIKGEGDKESSRIFAEAFGPDPEFYSFIRHLQAYKNSFKKGDSTIIIPQKSKFLQYMEITE